MIDYQYLHDMSESEALLFASSISGSEVFKNFLAHQIAYCEKQLLSTPPPPADVEKQKVWIEEQLRIRMATEFWRNLANFVERINAKATTADEAFKELD